MRFDSLYCNGNVAPLGTGKKINLSWNYAVDGNRNEKQDAFRITVRANGELFDTKKIRSGAMRFCLSDRLEIKPGTEYLWQVTAYSGNKEVISPVQTFETSVDGLSGAKWITTENDELSPIFERKFKVNDGLVSARAYISGVGFFLPTVNGRLASEDFLMPPNTLYDKFNYSETFDITERLEKGENVFGVWLGNGYNRDYSQYGYRYFCKKGCRALIVLTYEDGKTERLETDEAWTWRRSKVCENGLYKGEAYDNTLEDVEAKPVTVSEADAPKGEIIPDEMPHIRVINRLSPVNFWNYEEGIVYDFGSNIQGVTEIEVKAKAGTKIYLHHSEMIKNDGSPDFDSNRAAEAADVFVCKGGETEKYHPSFTYHGFRYVFVNFSERPESLRITALHLSADVEAKSSFVSSDPTLNRIHELSCHSMRCNLVSIPTDTPARDERTPCQMDSQMTEEADIANFNMESYYAKWFRDITNTPCRDGEQHPDWHGDYIMLAYRMYRFYGDKEYLLSKYDAIIEDIKTWIKNSDNGVYETGFGDWCLPNDNNWEHVGLCKNTVNTSLLYRYCCIAEELSNDVSNKENAELMRSYQELIRTNFCKKYLNTDGSVAKGRQTDMAMPLKFGVFDGATAKKVGKALIKRVKKDGHIDTGAYGTMALLPAVANAGGIDIMPAILGEGTFPGFGYQFASGSTSLWEQWSSKGVMNSHSHAMFAGIDASFYDTVCGVKPIKPAYRTFEVSPCLPKSVQFCKCELKTASGMIRVKISRLYGGLEIALTVPPNTEASLTVPEWKKYGKTCTFYDGERIIEKKRSYKLGSGEYQFRLVPDRCEISDMKYYPVVD